VTVGGSVILIKNVNSLPVVLHQDCLLCLPRSLIPQEQRKLLKLERFQSELAVMQRQKEIELAAQEAEKLAKAPQTKAEK